MSWDDRVEDERLFLKRCHKGDREAIRRFATRSCLNAVRQAVRVKLGAAYPEEQIAEIVVLCVGYIYSKWADIPSHLDSLHERVARAAIAFAADYRRRDLEAGSP